MSCVAWELNLRQKHTGWRQDSLKKLGLKLLGTLGESESTGVYLVLSMPIETAEWTAGNDNNLQCYQGIHDGGIALCGDVCNLIGNPKVYADFN